MSKQKVFIPSAFLSCEQNFFGGLKSSDNETSNITYGYTAKMHLSKELVIRDNLLDVPGTVGQEDFKNVVLSPQGKAYVSRVLSVCSKQLKEDLFDKSFVNERLVLVQVNSKVVMVYWTFYPLVIAGLNLPQVVEEDKDEEFHIPIDEFIRINPNLSKLRRCYHVVFTKGIDKPPTHRSITMCPPNYHEFYPQDPTYDVMMYAENSSVLRGEINSDLFDY